jgi:predicted DsbA family dithiol-disulfide isomerase
MAAQVGLPIVDRDWVSNSRLALEAAEFSRDQGMHHDFHRAVFHAYFAEGKDIGQLEVLREIATSVGLDAEAMVEAVERGDYRERVDQDLDISRRIGITGVPAFILGNRAIIGAQPYEAFEHVMELLGREKREH